MCYINIMEYCAVLTQSCPTPYDSMDCSPPGSSVHGDSPGKYSGVDCHTLLQGNLPSPGIKLRSPELQQTLYQLSFQGSTEQISNLKYRERQNHPRKEAGDPGSPAAEQEETVDTEN